MPLGAIADDVLALAAQHAGQIDADRDAFADVGIVAVDQPFGTMQVAQGFGAEQCMTAAEPDLRQAGTFAHQHRKRPRADLGIKRTVVAGLDAIETA